MDFCSHGLLQDPIYSGSIVVGQRLLSRTQPGGKSSLDLAPAAAENESHLLAFGVVFRPAARPLWRSCGHANWDFDFRADQMSGALKNSSAAGETGEKIAFATASAWLGEILVARSACGVCAIFLGDTRRRLVRELTAHFAGARLIEDGPSLADAVAAVVAAVEQPDCPIDLQLDIRGTDFQKKVWSVLREIPPGAPTSYSEVARRIGSPKALRAVAGACAANVLALAIPCHRVLRSNGSLSGYRWGMERKRALLEREKAP
jgi:AraC family transcriptional regulator of adaptative response/methylated-DNA-[protein]-cysteine methyltransferase